MFRFHVVHAIFWRNFKQYFTSVLGYLFIFVFVLTCAILTFNQQFFADNPEAASEVENLIKQKIKGIHPNGEDKKNPEPKKEEAKK